MIFISLKQNGLLCHVNQHVLFPGQATKTHSAHIQVEQVHNDCIAQALGQAKEARRPNRSYGLKFLRNRTASDCLAQLKTARDKLSDHSCSDAHEFAHFAVSQLVIWAEAHPKAVFEVT